MTCDPPCLMAINHGTATQKKSRDRLSFTASGVMREGRRTLKDERAAG